MQQVSDKFLTALRADSKSLGVVVELYHQNAVPGADGFDPAGADFLLGLTTAGGDGGENSFQFRSRSYKRLISKGGIGKISKTLGKQLSGFSMTISNSTRELIDFENEIGFDGLVIVVRLIDRAASTDLADSMVLFTGQCEPPDEFDKGSEQATIKAKQTLNATEIVAPRRTFTASDILGRQRSDPEFEGFPFAPRGGAISYKEKVSKGGLLGTLFAMKKTVTRTRAYSSHSDIQEETAVPLLFGRTQAELINFAYEDTGTAVSFIGFWADGHEYGLHAIENIRSVTENFPIVDKTTKLGLRGGAFDDASTQTNDDPAFVAGGAYSRTAYTRANASGSTLANDDAAPTVVGMLFGQNLPTPASDGTFTKIDFSDSAVAQSRWFLSSGYYFNLPEAWHDDEENLIAYNYGNHVLVDRQNTDTVLLPSSQSPYAGSQYHLYKSTGAISPAYFRHRLGDVPAIDAFGREADYQFYDDVPVNSDDWAGDGAPALPPTALRRRFTSNVQILEQTPGLDILFDILLASSNLYLVQKANGKIAHRHKKPEDFTFVRVANAVGAASIEVANVNPWLDKRGLILIGAARSDSEVRKITGVRFSPAGNNIPVSASGGITASGQTLSGASELTPASATLTITSGFGAKNYSINGFSFVYVPQTGDSIQTVAALVAAQINSHEILNKQVKAVWNNDATLTIQCRFGILDLDAPLEFVHQPEINNPIAAAQLTELAGGTLPAGTYQYAYSYRTGSGETITSPITSITVASGARVQTPLINLPARAERVRHYFSSEANGVRRRLHTENAGESFIINSLPNQNARLEPIFNTTASELHRVAFAFADKANTRTSLSRSNVLKGTFKFPMGGRNKNYNQVKIKFRDAAADYKLTTLIINDDAKQAKSKKPVTLEINGAAIDNEHQARRVANSRLAEASDGNKFYGFSSDNEALLIEEGDAICCTDESGRLVNEPARVEEVSIENCSSYPSVSFVCRKYRRYYYDDQVAERLVPLPIVQNNPINTQQVAPEIYQNGAAQNARIEIQVTDYSSAARFRRVEFDDNSLFATPAIIEQTAENEAGGVLDASIVLTRTANLTASETKFIRVAHSSNGTSWGAWSNVIEAAYTNASGTGGTVDTSDDVIIYRDFKQEPYL